MINTLNIGKVIYSLLHTIQVDNKPFDRIYPLIAENGTNFPFIIYSRDNIIPKLSKDGCYEDEVSITVKVVSSTYYGGLDLAQQVREKLTFYDLKSNNMIITSELDNATESYEENSYVQNLNFNLIINNN